MTILGLIKKLILMATEGVETKECTHVSFGSSQLLKLLKKSLKLQQLHQRSHYYGAYSDGHVYEDRALAQMKSILGCDVVHGYIREPSKRNWLFPFLTACPDFIVDVSWGSRRELVVVEVKHTKSPTELSKLRGKHDAFY